MAGRGGVTHTLEKNEKRVEFESSEYIRPRASSSLFDIKIASSTILKGLLIKRYYILTTRLLYLPYCTVAVLNLAAPHDASVSRPGRSSFHDKNDQRR